MRRLDDFIGPDRIYFTPIRIVVAFAVVLAAAALVSGKQARAQPSIRVIEKGVYQAETTGRTITQDGTGIRNTVRNPRLISDSALVYGKIGARFGVRYGLSEMSGPARELSLVIRFPAPGLSDPTTGKRYVESAQVATIEAGLAYYWEYHFENDWEIVPGVWTFEFWMGSIMVASQKFCVIHPVKSPAAAKIEGCFSLLSGAASRELRQLH